MKTFNGRPSGIKAATVGEVCTSARLLDRKGKVLVNPKGSFFPFGYRGVVSQKANRWANGLVPWLQVEEFPDYLTDGDCVSLSADGIMTVVWEKKAVTNSLLLTERCNCRCLMCPQPPKPNNDESLYAIAQNIIQTVSPINVRNVCITGGEPTLLGDKFFEFLATIKKRLPDADVMLLTNGKTFADYHFTKTYVDVAPTKIVTCISLHSDQEEIHDEIVGSKGSFHKTVQGLYNLARLRQRIEIRHVVSRINADRLEEFAHFTYRNFPFFYHLAFMGMEMTGLAVENLNRVWIDPYDYKQTLAKAVRVLSRAALYVSIYNIPLCLLEKQTWPFACQSISSWKNKYLTICDECDVKNKCAGFFATSDDRLSEHINPLNSYPFILSTP